MEERNSTPKEPQPIEQQPQPVDLNALYAITLKDPQDLTNEELKIAVKCMSTIP